MECARCRVRQPGTLAFEPTPEPSVSETVSEYASGLLLCSSNAPVFFMPKRVVTRSVTQSDLHQWSRSEAIVATVLDSIGIRRTAH